MADYKLQITNYKKQTANYKLKVRAAGCSELRTTYELPIKVCMQKRRADLNYGLSPHASIGPTAVQTSVVMITNFSNAKIGRQVSAVELPAKESARWIETSTYATSMLESRKKEPQ